ncbi:sensor histidine kinase [Marinobacter mobilis]|uniref:histidine kinase n=1 Tax=Marinobacter mobilis TaxID=488533 RepID=A0A1H2Y1I0_9GAMM|nr:ATP-binding protein [Marinobacter mobilis]SDW98911.1 PAS domain S-box-containing protein [Marinobacter mobilis]
MNDGLGEWLNSTFMGHGHCYLWRNDLVYLHSISDGAIALSYFTIPAALYVLMAKRKDLEYQWMFVLFALFIFACGATHVLSIWNIWNGDYYLSGVVKAITAVVSILTAILIWPLIPQALALPRPMQLQQANEGLRAEISLREKSERMLAMASSDLQRRVDELTETKRRLEQEISQRERMEMRFRNLFEASPVGLMLVKQDGRIQLVNQRVASMIGMSVDTLHGSNVRELVVGPDWRKHGWQRQDALALGEGGRQLPVEVGVNPLEAGEGAPMVVSLEDTTERQQHETRQREYTEALKRSNEELEQFAFIASHDLREPLRKLLSFTQLLTSGRYGQFDEKGQQFVSYIRDAAERMDALLSSLLKYSRVISQGNPFESVDLNDVVRDVQKDLQLSIAEAGVNIHVQALGTVFGDAVQLRQLFQNLISNSIRYRREGVLPEVSITGEPLANARYRLSVKDNGIGFDMKYKDQIFEIFKRLHGRSEYEGTGVGLAICRKIVMRHNGTIAVESVPGKGAEFTIVLPTDRSNNTL